RNAGRLRVEDQRDQRGRPRQGLDSRHGSAERPGGDEPGRDAASAATAHGIGPDRSRHVPGRTLAALWRRSCRAVLLGLDSERPAAAESACSASGRLAFPFASSEGAASVPSDASARGGPAPRTPAARPPHVEPPPPPPGPPPPPASTARTPSRP